LVEGVKRIGAARGSESVDFCPGAFNIVDHELAVRLVNKLRDDDTGVAFFNVIVSVIENLSRLPGFFDEAGTSALNVADIQGRVFGGKHSALLIQRLQVHGAISVVVIFHSMITIIECN